MHLRNCPYPLKYDRPHQLPRVFHSVKAQCLQGFYMLHHHAIAWINIAINAIAMSTPQKLTPVRAIQLMRGLTAQGLPFSLEFYSYNGTKHHSDGLKVVHKATLRQGLRNDQSDKTETLIAYTDHTLSEKPRFFNLALLMKLNDIKIEP